MVYLRLCAIAAGGLMLAGCHSLDVVSPLMTPGKAQPLLRQVAVIALNEATKLDYAEQVDAATAAGRIYEVQPVTIRLDPEQQAELVRAINESLSRPMVAPPP